MTYTLRFLPEVEDDVIGGYVWYEAKSRGLGEEFLRMFYTHAGEIPRNPLLYPKVYGEFRRCLLRRFPYAIYLTSNLFLNRVQDRSLLKNMPENREGNDGNSSKNQC